MVTEAWYASDMSHISRSSHEGFDIRMGDRGRLVLPAELRHALEIGTGDELVATLDGHGIRIDSRRQLAKQASRPQASGSGDYPTQPAKP